VEREETQSPNQSPYPYHTKTAFTFDDRGRLVERIDENSLGGSTTTNACRSPADVSNTLTKLLTGGEDCLRECAADRSPRVQRPGDSSAEGVSYIRAVFTD
jgi:hypothetical protein